MLRILFPPLLALALVVASPAQESAENAANAKIEKEVLEVEHQKDRAMRNRDMAVLDQIYADDLSFVNARGRVITKKEHMDEIQSGKVSYLSSDQSDYQVHAYGDTAVLTGVESSAVDYHGRVLRFPRRFTTVYIKQNGKWRYVAHQVTPVAPQ